MWIGARRTILPEGNAGWGAWGTEMSEVPLSLDGAYFDESAYDALVLEEYKALRAEILRCAGVISNTVWLGTSAFAVTIAAGLALDGDKAAGVYWILIALSIQSASATGMFLQELTKYARAGRYIREKIEHHFSEVARVLNNRRAFEHPLQWERWISHRRPWIYYLVSIIVLQLPNIFIFWLCYDFRSATSMTNLGLNKAFFELLSLPTPRYVLVGFASGNFILLVLYLWQLRREVFPATVPLRVQSAL